MDPHIMQKAVSCDASTTKPTPAPHGSSERAPHSLHTRCIRFPQLPHLLPHRMSVPPSAIPGFAFDVLAPRLAAPVRRSTVRARLCSTRRCTSRRAYRRPHQQS
jgi:hypothetical protein